MSMQPQRPLPHWLACCANQCVRIWAGTLDPVEGFFAHAGDGFIELVQRTSLPAHHEATALGPHGYRHTFIHIQHIVRIEPSEVQWRPPQLEKVERPKLVI